MFSICYIDESGCTGSLPSAIADIQPAFVVSGLLIDSEKIPKLTTRFVELKFRRAVRVAAQSDRLVVRFRGWVGLHLKSILGCSSSRQGIKTFQQPLGVGVANPSDCRFREMEEPEAKHKRGDQKGECGGKSGAQQPIG